MGGTFGTESDFEESVVERLVAQGWEHVRGGELARDTRDVVLVDVLRAFLSEQYPGLPAAALDEAVRRFSRPDGTELLRRNFASFQALREGIDVAYEDGGRRRHEHISAIDWDHPFANRFQVVNQLPVDGPRNSRRPDVLLYVNGLPLVVFELKNPQGVKPTVTEALNQIKHYREDIPQLFEHNALVVVSDGVSTLHGMWSASAEWYAPWRSIDGRVEAGAAVPSMKLLVEGLLTRDRLLAYVRDFIVFEEGSVGGAGGAVATLVKKGAKYHQFFAVTKAALMTEAAYEYGTEDRRLGLIWHTTGSGKSLSMLFLVARLRRSKALGNPTFVIDVDRSDLDDQLSGQFERGRSLVGAIQRAEGAEDLRRKLQVEAGGIVFTTLQKFRLQGGETRFPKLSKRRNIIVIADEAHRSQYGFDTGFARNLDDALPNARRLGFTGTPVSMPGFDTVQVFGDLIHTYDLRQAQEDGATVPIYYEARLARMHLRAARDVDADLAAIVDELAATTDIERQKSEWAQLAAATGAPERVAAVAKDVVEHFAARNRALVEAGRPPGKAIVVCMIRQNCVRFHEALRAIPGAPESKIVMTGDLGSDPVEWSEKGYLTTKAQRDAIKARLLKPDDPLDIVVVCDMWLTGTDIPCLHTLYVDKPMKGHSLIQAISRVNRVFRDKPSGLIVDYIGLGDSLREATAAYAKGGAVGAPAPDVAEEAWRHFVPALVEIRQLLREGPPWAAWKSLGPTARQDLFTAHFLAVTSDDDLRSRFLKAEAVLSAAFLLVKNQRSADDVVEGVPWRDAIDEVGFVQALRRQVLKVVAAREKPPEELDQRARRLVDEVLASDGIVDVYRMAGMERPDVSILDDSFLQTFKNRPRPDLQARLLARLVEDEIDRSEAANLARARSLRELLAKTLDEYHARIIDAAMVVQRVTEMHQEMAGDARRAKLLGLSEDEVAFYDAVAKVAPDVYDDPFLSGLIHEVVQAVKRTVRPDWTEPHRNDVRAAVRVAIKGVLRRKGLREDDFDPFVDKLQAQAEASFREWPLAA